MKICQYLPVSYMAIALCCLIFAFNFAGPYKVNGVPLRRVPQSYVIATKTKVDLSKLKTPDNLSDDFFRRQKKQKRRSEEMFEQSQEVSSIFVFSIAACYKLKMRQ